MIQETIQFTAQEKSDYRRPRVARLLLDLSLPWVQVVVGCTIFMIYPTFWTWLIAVVIIAGGQHGLSLISHEAAHRLIWPWNKRINDFLGTYFFAAPALLPFNVYRQRHLTHHRLVSQPGDTKTFYLRDLRRGRFLVEIIRSLSGVDYMLQAAEALRSGQGAEREKFASNLRGDQVSIVLVHGLLFLIFTAFDPMRWGVPLYYIILWIWPLVTLSFLFGKLRSVVEHQPPRSGLSVGSSTPYFMDTPAPVLRSVNATLIERLVLSKINFHYHAEHHLWPWVSYQYLPRINSKIWRGKNDTNPRLINGNVIVIERNYRKSLSNVLHGN